MALRAPQAPTPPFFQFSLAWMLALLLAVGCCASFAVGIVNAIQDAQARARQATGIGLPRAWEEFRASYDHLHEDLDVRFETWMRELALNPDLETFLEQAGPPDAAGTIPLAWTWNRSDQGRRVTVTLELFGSGTGRMLRYAYTHQHLAGPHSGSTQSSGTILLRSTQAHLAVHFTAALLGMASGGGFVFLLWLSVQFGRRRKAKAAARTGLGGADPEP
ncbi:MAG: hypothetical protein AMXMBFR7_29490 [Planctomycetota bacterium]